MAVQINEIDRQAAEWAAKADGGVMATADKAALDAWLAADPRHLGAYAKVCAVLVQVERLRATGAQSEYVLPRRAPSPTRRIFVVAGAMAACFALLTAGVLIGRQYLGQQTYSTELGETRVAALQDGSVVTLNTGTKLVARYSRDRREITLLHGEALFDVAKNKARPFVVTASDVAVRAVGTHFAVQSLASQPVQVTVREGIVELTRPGTPVVAPVQVRANEHAVAPTDAPIAVTHESEDRIAQLLAWQSGRIVFADEPLASAAAAFSRYSTMRIVIDDPAVARRTVTGRFVANDPIGFAKAAAVSLDLDVDVEQDSIRLAQKRH